MRAKLPHFVTISHAKYDNDQNEDVPGVEILYEIMQDMETLLYLTKIMQSSGSTCTIDVGDVDKLVRRLYQRAQASRPTISLSSAPSPQSNPNAHTGAIPRANPDAHDNSDSHNFCTIADLFEHQDVVAETDVFANKRTSAQDGVKTRKQGLKTARVESLDTATQKRGSSHGPTPERRVTFNIPDNSNRDMQETMSSDRRKQRKQPAPRKDSLNSAYSDDQLATAG
jgi:hypothetical protein